MKGSYRKTDLSECPACRGTVTSAWCFETWNFEQLQRYHVACAVKAGAPLPPFSEVK